MKTLYRPLSELSADALRLTCDSAAVITMRLALAAVGGARASTEAMLMVSEKAQTALDAQFLLARCLIGGEAHLAPARTVALYADRVQANRRRLSQSF
jgi:hypothetical protein